MPLINQLTKLFIIRLVMKITAQKKGRSLVLLPFFVLMISCVGDLSKYGRVTLHNTSDRESFIFSVNDAFLAANPPKQTDKATLVSEAENKLLIALLTKKKYCLDSHRKPSFTISSRQEKIYDMTFAHLIEKNYNARPVAPRMYFGRCKHE